MTTYSIIGVRNREKQRKNSGAPAISANKANYKIIKSRFDGVMVTGDAKDDGHFSSMEDEVSYWKNIAEDSLCKLKSLREEFEEYQKESVELEEELETQLEQHS